MKKIFCFLFLCFFSSFAFYISAFALDVPAESFSLVGADYNAGEDYCNSFSSIGGSVPSGYSLACIVVEPHDFSNGHTRARYFYLPSSCTQLTFYTDSSGRVVLSKSPNSSSFYEVVNRFDFDSQQFNVSSGGGYVSSFSSPDANWLFISYLQVLDENGNVFIPDALPQFHLNLLSISDQLHYNVSNVSSDIGSIDYYLFPSSFPASGGAVRNIITSPVAISEIPASVYYEIENDGFASVIDTAFDVYNSVHGLMPAVTFYSHSSVSRLNRIFDVSSYSLPYVKLGTYNINGHFGVSGGGQYLDLNKIANNSSGVYAYDNLCIIAVGHKNERDFIARVDFNVSSLRNSSVVPPNDVIDSNTYQGGTITDLQELANYLKYLFENSDHNLSVEFHNFTAYIQHIPWKSMIEEGIYYGFSDVIPRLQDLVFDTDFDLPSLMNELAPLLQNNQLSLPDLTGALAPYFNGLDITPTGNFAGLLGNMNNNFQLHLDSLFDDINNSVTDLSTDLHDSVTDLSTEINNNTTEIFVPDLDDMNDRLELSGTLLSNKFKFVDDVKDNLEDVRDTIANSSESPPDWHFTVFGVRLFLVDWSVYEPYRGTVKNIFVCIAYILLFKHIYKTIPLNGGDDS
ncbi:hypothetical protein [Ruminococcus albus]|uniref:Uncharacterized protein n=1 Tax=Ruminococcus albus TaxID=1264 RepID=A0A1H7MBX9_RUMAL|nr:hypothetical protein [Ruminococcus albus]SEL08703.1 hypothetical protein SAMN05216469_11168 [Ruminococcus albus]